MTVSSCMETGRTGCGTSGFCQHGDCNAVYVGLTAQAVEIQLTRYAANCDKDVGHRWAQSYVSVDGRKASEGSLLQGSR